MIIPLSDLQKGQKAILKTIDSEALEIRMLEFGFVEGAVLTLVEKAPFGDPIIIENADTKLILRKKDTNSIQVEPII